MIKIILPIHSNRRNFVRSLKESIFSYSSLRGKFNYKSFRIFRKYANRRFKCNICNSNSQTSYDFPDLNIRKDHNIGILRETLQCKSCFETMRQRTLSFIFLEEFNNLAKTNFKSIYNLSLSDFDNNQLAILDTDSFSKSSSLLKNKEFYNQSFYDHNLELGKQVSKRKYNINLENISFDKESFDIVLTTEVMEHVRLYKRAHSEIYRILKRGGVYIFTVPYIKSNYEHIELVEIKNDKDIFLVEPQYHGDPLNKKSGVLAYRVFGSVIKKELENIGFDVEYHEINDPSKAIFKGDVFIARKVR